MEEAGSRQPKGIQAHRGGSQGTSAVFQARRKTTIPSSQTNSATVHCGVDMGGLPLTKAVTCTAKRARRQDGIAWPRQQESPGCTAKTPGDTRISISIYKYACDLHFALLSNYTTCRSIRAGRTCEPQYQVRQKTAVGPSDHDAHYWSQSYSGGVACGRDYCISGSGRGNGEQREIHVYE